MELHDVMRTTFAAREFTDDDIPDTVIRKILENARFAPSGGNRQGWKVVVVRKTETREKLVPLIEPTLKRYIAQVMAGEAPWNTINETKLTQDEIAAQKVSIEQIKALTHAPVVMFVFVDLSLVTSMDQNLDRIGVISGASIYPFVWNILLAARNEGLGGTLTTFISGNEPALQRLLGAPPEMAFAAMIPLGKPVKQLTKLKRKPVDDFAVLEHWSGEPLSE